MRRLARNLVHCAVRRAATRLNYEILWKSYYNGIPDLDALPPGFWEKQSALRGVDLDLPSQLAFVNEELAPYLTEFTPRSRPDRPGRFYLDNGGYESGDAHVLYAMVRRHKPRRVIELGSGFSTLVIEEALERNGAEGARCEHLVIDPFPQRRVLEGAPAVPEIIERSAADIGQAFFADLASGDILFVDTTHTVKVGGEVNHVLLEVMPALAPGVLVHFHDVFLPFEYPRHLVEQQYFWAEQYLLQAFLAFNAEWRPLLSLHALSRAGHGRAVLASSNTHPENCPSAFWITRRAARWGAAGTAVSAMEVR